MINLWKKSVIAAGVLSVLLTGSAFAASGTEAAVVRQQCLGSGQNVCRDYHDRGHHGGYYGHHGGYYGHHGEGSCQNSHHGPECRSGY